MARKAVDRNSKRALQGRQKRMDDCLRNIKRKNFTLFEFLEELLLPCKKGDPRQSKIRTTMLRTLLAGRKNTPSRIEEIADLIYDHPYSKPRRTRTSANRTAADAPRRNYRLLARWRLINWAIGKVEDIVSGEASDLTSKAGGLQSSGATSNWEAVLGFSMRDFLLHIQQKAPVLLRLLIAIAFQAKNRPHRDAGSTSWLPSYSGHFSTPISSGTGRNPRDPFMMVLAAALVLLNARNRRFNLFQRIVGVWMFSHTAPHGMYAVLGRLGLSVSYTSVLSFLQVLSQSAINAMREKATHRAFLLIYDNINRMSRSWNPELGKKDTIHNGTAATFVELEDCDIHKAFDGK
ncbi:hypothetical protein OF83DRAFT_1176932 [Amylostereum chailletii]|nr:hypothetical protein OF83DRAFT_1176932 [Amylostereum chailletii]